MVLPDFQPINSDTTEHSHMPFLMMDNVGNRVLFFCAMNENNLWKLHVTVGDGMPQWVETGLSVEMIECSPTAWEDDSGWHLTFIAGGAADDPLYHLYRMDGPTLDTLSKPVAIRPTRAGFLYLDRLVVAEIQDVFHVHDHAQDTTIEIPGVYIYRVAYRADDTDQLLITGSWINETDEIFTLEYDLRTGQQHLIECDGKPAYKCTIYEDEILNTERIGEHFEQRRIRNVMQTNFRRCLMAQKRSDDSMAQNRNRTRTCRCKNSAPEPVEPVSRPGCLECVEKHLGAACTILSEIHAGYAYHLRFIGHLHEAEEESQQWQPLHRLIRKARKDYQQSRLAPDWETLAQEMAKAKEAQNHAD